MVRRRNGRRWRSYVALASVLALTASCGPAPGGGATWVGTRLARDAGPPVVNRLGGWADDEWFATVEVTSGTTTTTELVIHPRTGAAGEQLGTPQRLTVAANGLAAPMGDGIIGLPSAEGISFFTEADGVWAPAGSHPVPEGWRVAALDDEWLALATIPGYTTGVEGVVRMHPLDTAGTGVVVGAPQLLGPDASWPSALREGFGHRVSLDGTLLAVSGTSASEPGPGGLRIFRLDAGTWTPGASLGGTPATSYGFAREHDVHDGADRDRLVLAPAFGDPSETDVEVWSDTGAGWTHEQTLTRDPSLPDGSDGIWFGAAVSLDGDRLALVSRSVTVPSADPDAPPVEVGHVEVHRLSGSGSVREAELSPFVSPFDAATLRAAPLRLDLTGDHLGVDVLITREAPPGCPFPCLSVLGFEAWSFTRT